MLQCKYVGQYLSKPAAKLKYVRRGRRWAQRHDIVDDELDEMTWAQVGARMQLHPPG